MTNSLTRLWHTFINGRGRTPREAEAVRTLDEAQENAQTLRRVLHEHYLHQDDPFRAFVEMLYRKKHRSLGRS